VISSEDDKNQAIDNLQPTVALHTLGCRLNQYETEAIRERFVERGFQVVPFSEVADVYVINTCTVTNQADNKARQVLRRAIRRAPDATIVATGCYAQTNAGDLLKIEGVDLVLGNAEKSNLVDLVLERTKESPPESFVTRRSDIKTFDDRLDVTSFECRTRATLKIQDGCDKFCSFCIIPWARGRHRSRSLSDIHQQARTFLDAGYKEIVLSGVHIGEYGTDLKESVDLNQVIESLLALPDLSRLRLSSIWPTDVNPTLIKLMEQHAPRFCRYLHLAVQHGDDEILTAMKRSYTVNHTELLIKKLNDVIPNICIGADIMVGFPGETDAHFQRMYDFLNRLPFAYFHVFTYSPRSHTIASRMQNPVHPEIAKERSQKIRALSEYKSRCYNDYFIDKEVEVLVEERSNNGRLIGRTDRYLKVELPGENNLINTIVKLKIGDTENQGAVQGVPVNP
jgi:threonylcarbamoyladenosine tRNA methylthiotransferase MtaB